MVFVYNRQRRLKYGYLLRTDIDKSLLKIKSIGVAYFK